LYEEREAVKVRRINAHGDEHELEHPHTGGGIKFRKGTRKK